MSTAPLSIGIDVSKRELVCALRYRDHVDHVIKTNTKAGIRALDNRFRQCPCPIIMESTGRYHFLPALLLSGYGYDIRVVNPITTKRYMRGSVRNTKSDPVDATALAHMALLDLKLPARFTFAMSDIALRQKIGLLSKLEKKLQSLRMMQREYEEVCALCSMELSTAEIDLQEQIVLLGRTQERLQQEIETLVCADDAMRHRVDLLVTIPGVSLRPGDHSLRAPLHGIDASKAMDCLRRIGCDGAAERELERSRQAQQARKSLPPEEIVYRRLGRTDER